MLARTWVRLLTCDASRLNSSGAALRALRRLLNWVIVLTMLMVVVATVKGSIMVTDNTTSIIYVETCTIVNRSRDMTYTNEEKKVDALNLMTNYHKGAPRSVVI